MAVDRAGSCWDLSRRRPCTLRSFPVCYACGAPADFSVTSLFSADLAVSLPLGWRPQLWALRTRPLPAPAGWCPAPPTPSGSCHARGCHGLGGVHPTRECRPTRTGNSSSPAVGSPRCPRLSQGPSKVQPCPSFLSLLFGHRETTEVAGSHSLPHEMDAPHRRPARVLGPPLPGLPEDVQDLRAREAGSGTVTNQRVEGAPRSGFW